jgi:anti-sigma B factor antagonist
VTLANLSVDERLGLGEIALVLTGELDVATAPLLRAAVERAAVERVVLDFDGVTFCDSQGLSVLIKLNNTASARGGQFVLTNLGDFMVRLLDVTGLRPTFTIE